jgi:hypothetical protein
VAVVNVGSGMLVQKTSQVGHKQRYNGYLLKCAIYLRKERTKDKDLLREQQEMLRMTGKYTGKYHNVQLITFLLQ